MTSKFKQSFITWHYCMRAKLEQIQLRQHDPSFICFEVNTPSFDMFWHYHPEYELTYIVHGNGERIVGDSFENFSDGDLVLLGPNLPHTWFTEKRKMKCHAVVLQFHAGFMQLLQEFPELVSIKKLLDKSSAGIHFAVNTKSHLPVLIKEIEQAKGAEALSKFIMLLDKLSGEKARTLSSQQFRHAKRNANEKRINKIFQYVQQKFSMQISIAEAAAIVHLSVSAFCKFFKRACGKTFSDYVNEIRIANACRLLIDTDKPVARIAFDSGFESLSYFNRVFLKKKKMRPKNFRKKMS